VLQGLTALAGAAALPACGSADEVSTALDESPDAGGTEPPGGDAGAEASADAGAEASVEAGSDAGADADAGEAEAGGPSCSDNGGLTAAELLAPIETIVVLMMENRSFDHYLGTLKLLEGRAVDGLTGNETNPAPNGTPVKVHQLTSGKQDDPPHEWDAAHAQFNAGANDGFVKAHAGSSQEDVMGYFARAQLPITYALADSFAVCDRWFSSVMGPTWPNRFYLHGATSKGQKRNLPSAGLQSIFQALDQKGISNKNYFVDLPWASGGYFKLSGLAPLNDFLAAAAAGTLPQFSIIDPGFSSNDDHPSHDVALGQALIATVFTALAKSPQWSKCLFVLTYDENGGFYDHVPPPKTVDDLPEFEQLGFRVPSIVCGPFVRNGCVVSTQYEHVSVISTVTTRFGLAPLNARVAATHDLSDCIDPAYLADPRTPPALPTLSISVPDALARVGRTSSQPELEEMADRGLIPPHLDRRAKTAETIADVLRHGERLGALRLRR
jgi:phospholipase C